MNKQTLLVSILVVVVFGLGFLMGRMTVPQLYTVNSDGSTGTIEQSGDEQSVSGDADSGATTIDSSNMTEGQRKLISALGLDPNNVTVTAEMMSCAEAKLGAPRVEEIKNGATPSFSEGVSLVACYK